MEKRSTHHPSLPCFAQGDIIMLITPDGLVVDFRVTEVLAEERIRVQSYDQEGALTARSRCLGARELAQCHLNAPATRALRKLAERT